MHSHSKEMPLRPLSEAHDGVYQDYHNHSSAPRISTDAYIIETIRKQHPSLHVSPILPYNINLLSFAAAGKASATPVDADGSVVENLKWRMYSPPTRRLEGGSGYLADSIQFGKFLYKWEGHEYILYCITGAVGLYGQSLVYLLGTPESNDRLLLSAGLFGNQIHNAVLVFDGGYWQSSPELWHAVQDAHWSDVILEEKMKKSVIGEITKFFDSRSRYQNLRVPWRRGIIFHGPPGNGKTISIKAMMHSLYSRTDDPIPTLYVRSLTSYGGPESSLNQIFTRARRSAPCLLVFEDLDSIVTDAVRSYFLNEVDGLKANDGILMVGSTNHLDRLDPGISKRPSRFDRKYLFPEPNFEQRVQYCAFWRKKLHDNEDVEFPEQLERAVAAITKGFSFAYIQEAFVAALLAIANGDAGKDDDDNDDDDGKTDKSTFDCEHTAYVMMVLMKMEAGDDKDLERYVLWREIKKVVKTLREELND